MNYFLLGGAPKCGTSALFNHLAKHKSIIPSNPKETFFFLDQGHPLKKNYGISKGKFIQFFDIPKEDKILLEGTTHLIYQNECIDLLSKNNDYKILFVLRNPIDRLFSSFNYSLNNLGVFQKRISFDDFITLLLNMNIEELDKLIMSDSSKYVLSRDIEYGNYFQYLKKWFDKIDSSRIKVVLYEELATDPGSFFKDIYDFVGLSEVSSALLEKKNETFKIRNNNIHKMIMNNMAIVNKLPFVDYLKKIYFLIQKNSEKDEMILSDKNRERLNEFYAKEIPQLEKLIRKDLSIWVKGNGYL